MTTYSARDEGSDGWTRPANLAEAVLDYCREFAASDDLSPRARNCLRHLETMALVTPPADPTLTGREE